MRTYLDELLEMEASPSGHSCGCGCSNCQKGKTYHAANCNCPGCRRVPARVSLHSNEYEWLDELGSTALLSALAYNKKNAASVGWLGHYNDIVSKVFRLNHSPGEAAFAELVAKFQAANGLTADGKLGPATWNALKRALEALVPVAIGTIEDFTGQATPGQCASARNATSCLGGTRALSSVNAVVLHQTAGSQNNDPRHYLWVGAHFVVLPNGRIIQLYPESRIVYHAQSFNSRSVGIEFAGTFADDKGRCWWSSGQYVNRGHGSGSRVCGDPTPAQIAAGRRLLTALKAKIPTIRYVFAHRQASSSRDNDPGPTTWLQIGEWAKQNLGLTDGGNSYKEGSGSPIPDSWRRGLILP